MDDWIENMWYINTMEYYSVKEKMKYAICNNMDGSWEHHGKKINKVEKDKNHMILVTSRI